MVGMWIDLHQRRIVSEQIVIMAAEHNAGLKSIPAANEHITHNISPFL
jgi:hypothetical protein